LIKSKQKERIEQLSLKKRIANRKATGESCRNKYGRIPEATKTIEHLKQKLSELQKGSPLNQREVDPEEIAEVVSTGQAYPLVDCCK
jgi:hypothetical protein